MLLIARQSIFLREEMYILLMAEPENQFEWLSTSDFIECYANKISY